MDKKKKSIALYFLIPGAVCALPGVLYFLYKVCEAIAVSIILTLQEGEIGPICTMFGGIGLILLFIGGLIWAEGEEDSGYEME